MLVASLPAASPRAAHRATRGGLRSLRREPHRLAHLRDVLARREHARRQRERRRRLALRDPRVHQLGSLFAVPLRADDHGAEEAGRLRLLELAERRVRAADADADHVGRLEAAPFGRAHRAEHRFVVQAVGDPVLELRILRERDVRRVERVLGVGLRLRRGDHVRLRKARGDERVGRARRAVVRGRQLLVRDVDRADFVHVPAAPLDLGRDPAADLLADVVRGNAHVRNRFDRLARAVDEPVIDRHHLQAVRLRLRDDARPELHVRRADDEALRLLRGEIVDRAHHLLAGRRADLHEREALVLRGELGEFPFVLEPRLLGLLDEEADLHGLGRLRGQARRRDRRRCRQRDERSAFHVACLLVVSVSGSVGRFVASTRRVRPSRAAFARARPSGARRARESVVVQHRAAAVDRDAARVDERRFVRREEYRGHRDFVGTPDPLHRLQRERLAARGLRIGLRAPPVMRQLRLDVAGRDRVHAHVARRVFDAERAREAQHAMLRDRVRETARNDLERMRRRDVHDAAAPALDHAGQRRAAAVPDAVEIDREAAPPVFVGERERIAEHVDAGVVHEHVERAECALRARKRRRDRLGLRDVRRHREHPRAGRIARDRVGALFGERRVELRDRDGRAFAHERARDRRADAAPRARHDRDLAREPVHRAAPWRAIRHPLMNACARTAVTALVCPGAYSAEPRPKPLAPAARYGPMFSGVIPPTGTSGTRASITARHAFTAGVPSCSAGNIFSTSAPFASAANASVGVATPGAHPMPSVFARRTTSPSACGITISSPPARTTSSTCPARSTVPAPTIASAGSAVRSAAILSNGSGELSGTSTMRKPASYSAAPCAAASAGVTPRRIAIIGHAPNARISARCGAYGAGKRSASASIDMSSPPATSCRDARLLRRERRVARCADEPRLHRDAPQAALRRALDDARIAATEFGERAAVTVAQRAFADEARRKRRERRMLAAEQRLERIQFVTDQQSGQIVALRVRRELPGEAERARAEQRREQPFVALAPRGPHAARERGPVGRIARLHRAAEDRVPAQRGEQLARHVSPKPFDTPAAHPCPFRMRAGQPDQRARAFGRERGLRRERTDNLRFLAAHHVRQLARLERARHDRERGAARGAKPHEARRERVGGGRHRHVRRLAPALRAADHAGRQRGHVRRAVEPRAARALERGVERLLRRRTRRIGQAHHARGERARVEHRAVGGKQVRAQRRRAPVEPDERGRARLRRHRLILRVACGALQPRSAEIARAPRCTSGTSSFIRSSDMYGIVLATDSAATIAPDASRTGAATQRIDVSFSSRSNV
ncbi:hypothetical protein BURPS1710b_3486 [Burkholderia pseudomallei 1710b]|uniref:Uncharacterized protein n=1 Tax=Burkholderia pseudomallei (strain 1710b) TaxID=320372 RepID=Q3JNJ8_BURP1|nr:hypothetical protein BURPS1710b_3486 [Burkholderia pseudomallei 1710b]